MNVMAERYARILALTLVIGLILIIVITRWLGMRGIIEVHAAMPENGGWSVDNLTIDAGQPLNLRLVSDDVVHGFAIGQDDRYNLDLMPGQPVETSLVFERPGKYVFYCTRWCGPNHWRMRGTIEVIGQVEEKNPQPPIYVTRGLDIDAEHHAGVIPKEMPSAINGAALNVDIAASYLLLDYYQTHSPGDVWQDLRTEQELTWLEDRQIWDLVAYIWSTHTTPDALVESQKLYAANCAACHGETGAGDGVYAEKPNDDENHDQIENTEEGQHNIVNGHETGPPSDFTDPEHMIGASPAILHGKIVRGGMGTGMPYWGPIFSDEQIWDLVSYLWTFQFYFEE
jgi:cytochrome c oxidase subunit 2